MARIIVIGAGVGGLTSGMLLARDGHDVTVLERDPAPPPGGPDDAWEQWERRGVNQFRMIHMFLPRFRALLETELPNLELSIPAGGPEILGQPGDRFEDRGAPIHGPDQFGEEAELIGQFMSRPMKYERDPNLVALAHHDGGRKKRL